MYKGKFDQKSKKSSSDIREIVSQRNAAPAPQAPKKTAPVKEAPVKEAPVRKAPPVQAEPEILRKEAPKKAPPAPKAAQSPKKQPAEPVKQPKKETKKKKGPRIGGVIFYTLYFLFILLFAVALLFGLNIVKNWLITFEYAQPDLKAQQVFTELFADPNWGELYDAAGIQDTAYEGKEEFMVYMDTRMGTEELTFLETSAGLSGDKKFVVRLGDEKVASFTLTDKNQTQATGNALKDMTVIPDWQFKAVELFFDREATYNIRLLDSHVAHVNGVALDDNFTISKATTKVEDYLPEGATGAAVITQQISGLMTMPTVTITDKNGNDVAVTYDEATRTFAETTVTTAITPEQEQVALAAARVASLWMIKEVTDRSEVAKYFNTSYDAYKNIVNFKRDDLIVQDYNSYEIASESVSKFTSYSEDLFSVLVKLDLNIIRTNGTIKNFPYHQSLVFQKNEKGEWLVVAATNEDVSEPVGKVRLTFMNGDEQLYSNFFYTDANKVITPVISAAPNQVFSGWVRRDVGEDGTITLTIVFQPDPTTGEVKLPEGTTLEPMTLYAYFQDAGTTVSFDAPETTPETTEGAA